MKNYILLCVVFFLLSLRAQSQGCIPVRNLVGFGQFALPEYGEEVKWLVNVNNRYFTSYLEFKGSVDQHIPEIDQRVNHIYTLNFTVTRLLENGWSLSLELPFTAADRTTWQEHENDQQNKVRRTVHSFGLGDIRIVAYKWLLDVSEQHRGNIQLGLGLKLATGDYRFQDFFYKAGGLKVLAPVNPSIQLGDGGTGFTTEINGFYTLNGKISLYGNLFYLFNPRDMNGVSNTTGSAPTPGQIANDSYINSVPDVYSARVGGNFRFNSLNVGAGFRMEGTPTHDLIGASNGGRRAGKTISIEPGLNYRYKKSILYTFVPVPIYRATQQTVPDKITTGLTGTDTLLSGGFTDYMVFVGVLFML